MLGTKLQCDGRSCFVCRLLTDVAFGLRLLATTRYTITKKNLKDLFVHLTNYSINKDSADFQANAGDGDEASGHKWSFAALKRHWAEQGVDVGRVMAAVRHLVAKTFVAVEAEVWGRCYEMMGSRASAFELFGFDLMFEEDLTPRLVEVGSLQPAVGWVGGWVGGCVGVCAPNAFALASL